MGWCQGGNYTAERLQELTPNSEGLRSALRNVYTRAVSALEEAGVAPQFAAEKAGALAVASLGLGTAYYGATHPEWTQWIGKHGGEIGKIIGEKGSEMAEKSVEIGRLVVKGLKDYHNWANRAADRFLEMVVPGYNDLPEK